MGELRELLTTYGGVAAAAVLGAAALVVPPRLAQIPAARRALRSWLWALCAIALMHVLFVVLAKGDRLLYTVTDFWPLRIFGLRMGLFRWPDAAWSLAGIGVIVGCAFYAVARPRITWLEIWGVSFLLVVSLNAAQGGLSEGLTGSVTNPPHLDQMYDAVSDVPPLSQLDELATIQAWRSPHAKSHPPLPMLLMGLARQAGLGPSLVGWCMATLASLAPALALVLYRMFRPHAHRIASRLAVLLALSPAVNIYSGTSTEGPYLTLALAVCVVFAAGVRRKSRGLLALSGLLYCLLCLYSFGAAWMAFALPFLGLAIEPGYFRRFRALLFDAAVFSSPLLACYGILRFAYDYDYLAHVSNLSKSLMGVHWLSSPLVALESRLQNVAELVVLGSPVLVAAWMHAAIRLKRSARAWVVRWASCGLPMGALLMLTPVYSEFARGWIILAPLLVLPAAPWLRRPDSARLWLLGTGACTWLLQAFGYHGW